MAWIVGLGIALALIFLFPRQMGVLILVLIAGAAGLYFYFQQQWTNAARERSQVTASASVDSARCTDPNYPIAIAFRNGSSRTVLNVRFTILAHQPGFSGSRYSSYSSSDRIMRPGEGHLACWSLERYRSQTLAMH